MRYTFLCAMLPSAVHGSGAELIDMNGLRIIYSLYAEADSLHYVRKQFFVKNALQKQLKLHLPLLMGSKNNPNCKLNPTLDILNNF